MRIGLSAAVLAIGIVTGVVSYFVLAAPLGTPTNPDYSNPNMLFAATLFVASIVAVCISPLIYELLPGAEGE